MQPKSFLPHLNPFLFKKGGILFSFRCLKVMSFSSLSLSQPPNFKKIIVFFRLEGTMRGLQCGNITDFRWVAQGFVQLSLENSPRTTSSLGNLPQCFVVLIENLFFSSLYILSQNLLWFNTGSCFPSMHLHKKPGCLSMLKTRPQFKLDLR